MTHYFYIRVTFYSKIRFTTSLLGNQTLTIKKKSIAIGGIAYAFHYSVVEQIFRSTGDDRYARYVDPITSQAIASLAVIGKADFRLHAIDARRAVNGNGIDGPA